MTCLLNEEIRAIQTTIAQLNRGIALESNQKTKEEMKQKVKELQKLLKGKLGEDTNYEY